jgi:hypothetical protein
MGLLYILPYHRLQGSKCQEESEAFLPLQKRTLRCLEMSVFRNTQRHIPEYRNPQLHRLENIKTRTSGIVTRLGPTAK